MSCKPLKTDCVTLLSGDSANLPCPLGFAAGNESSSTVNAGLWIMRGQLSAVREAKIRTKYIIIQLFFEQFCKQQVILHAIFPVLEFSVRQRTPFDPHYIELLHFLLP